jgi:hypothetical protein
MTFERQLPMPTVFSNAFVSTVGLSGVLTGVALPVDGGALVNIN